MLTPGNETPFFTQHERGPVKVSKREAPKSWQIRIEGELASSTTMRSTDPLSERNVGNNSLIAVFSKIEINEKKNHGETDDSHERQVSQNILNDLVEQFSPHQIHFQEGEELAKRCHPYDNAPQSF